MTAARTMRMLIALFASGACSLALAGPAHAITFTVDDLSDVADATPDTLCDATGPDTCTLRAALDELNTIGAGVDTINISVAGTINLPTANGHLPIVAPTVVNGNAGGTTIDAGGTSRVLVTAGSSVTLNDLRLQNGAVQDSDGAGILSSAALLTLNRITVADNTVDSAGAGYAGGGIKTGGGSALVLNDSTISGNTVIGTAGFGGGIRAGGPLTLNRSTVSGNSTTLDAGGRGGGIDAVAGSAFALNISNSTISGNHSGGNNMGNGGGGGVFATTLVTTFVVGSTIAGNTTLGFGGGVNLVGSNSSTENTIYAGNTDGFGGGPNCGGSFTSAENNIDTGTSCLFGTTNGNQQNVAAGPLGLGALASNGGPTQTRAIASGSVAQNATSGDCGGLTVDQRGTARPQGASCDIGAFELVVPPPAPPATPSTPTTAAKKTCKKGQKLKKGKCVKKKRKK